MVAASSQQPLLAGTDRWNIATLQMLVPTKRSRTHYLLPTTVARALSVHVVAAAAKPSAVHSVNVLLAAAAGTAVPD